MPSMFSSIVCTRGEMSTISPTYPCTAAFCIDGGRPPQMMCHSRVVGLPHDVTAWLVIFLLTCLPKAVKGSPAPPWWPNATDGAPAAPAPPKASPWPNPPIGPSGEPTRLSEGGAGGSGTAQGTTVSESSRPTNGEPARLSGVAPSQRAAEAEASPRAHGEPVRQSEKRASGSGSGQAAAVSELLPRGRRRARPLVRRKRR